MHPSNLKTAPANPHAAKQMAPNVGGAEGFPGWPAAPPAKFQGKDAVSFLSTFERYADYLRVEGRSRSDLVSKFMEEEKKAQEQIAEEHLAKPLDIEDNPVQRIVVAGRLINLATKWNESDKIERLIEFLPVIWAEKIMSEYEGVETFQEILEKAKALANRRENLPQWARKWVASQSNNKPSHDKVSSSVKIVNGDRDQLAEEIEEMRMMMKKMSLKVEALARERGTVRFSCYYCAEEGHRTGSCVVLREDMAKGLVKEDNGRYCFPSGKLIPRAKAGMRSLIITNSTKDGNTKELNLVQGNRTGFPRNEATVADATAKRRRAEPDSDDLVDERGIPRVLPTARTRQSPRQAASSERNPVSSPTEGAGTEESSRTAGRSVSTDNRPVVAPTRDQEQQTERMKRAPPTHRYLAPVERGITKESPGESRWCADYASVSRVSRDVPGGAQPRSGDDES
ncbi:hypothetical protein GQ54DRAFT_115749 [Martensiomyces pterosporus]|nr:hypothetical protein GQ54DRAFT_115749 [Martensiomyces pterosporus]